MENNIRKQNCLKKMGVKTEKKTERYDPSSTTWMFLVNGVYVWGGTRQRHDRMC